MKKIRQYFNDMKEAYLTANINEQLPVYMLANFIFICSVFMIIHIISCIVYNYFEFVGICMIICSSILFFVYILWDRAFSTTIRFSAKILDHFFARYGPVVSKYDWKRIKRNNKIAYKFIWDKENIEHCYAVTWVLASWLDDAKIMYCSIKGKECDRTAHAVILKNNSIYDTNLRRHCNYDEYIKVNKAEIYKIFEKEIYSKESFFDDIRQDFVKWCKERNVYCNPQ